MPTKEDFQVELRTRLRKAEATGAKAIKVDSRVLHMALGGYPGHNHQMSSCHQVMREEMRPGDEMLQDPPWGRGATMITRYLLPR